MFFAKLNNIHIIYKFIVHSKHRLVPLLYVHDLRMVALAYNEYYLSLFRCFPNLIANPLSKSRWAFIRNCFLVFSTAFLPFAALPYGQIRRHELSVRRECPVRLRDPL